MEVNEKHENKQIRTAISKDEWIESKAPLSVALCSWRTRLREVLRPHNQIGRTSDPASRLPRMESET